MIFTIQSKYFLLVHEFSHFPLALVFQILPAMDAARREPGATTIVKRAFSWLSVPVWVKGSRKRQLLLRVSIYHSSAPHFSSLKMPLNCNIFSYLCAVEKPSVNGVAKGHCPTPSSAWYDLHLPSRSAQQHHCGPWVSRGTFWMMLFTPVDFGRDLWAAFTPSAVCAGAWCCCSLHLRAAPGSLLYPLSPLSSLLLCP